ncbi:hypothetical protein N7462_006850 [Penicillium macrosclerotiorum]|uniref:uncharacterized protein n=1 Tax=Penicillium macrosclerotiorum TaxID=303699 RepID=UPI0025485A02|nr:uncharacterized protein N7462_006850 [Penicillium macrosclerotiorum]KAJ5678606.1 hypothetical protein N7462_006850 [Penicillium macrosclerotiorum]
MHCAHTVRAPGGLTGLPVLPVIAVTLPSPRTTNHGDRPRRAVPGPVVELALARTCLAPPDTSWFRLQRQRVRRAYQMAGFPSPVACRPPSPGNDPGGSQVTAMKGRIRFSCPERMAAG